jgi:hypothetical protein
MNANEEGPLLVGRISCRCVEIIFHGLSMPIFGGFLWDGVFDGYDHQHGQHGNEPDATP